MKRIVFVFLVSFLTTCSDDNDDEKGDLVKTLTEKNCDTALQGAFAGSLVIGKSLLTGVLDEGSSYAITLTRSDLCTTTTHEIFQKVNSKSDTTEPTEEIATCETNDSFALGDYESQIGCVVDSSTSRTGSVTIILDGIGAQDLGVGSFDDYSSHFFFSGSKFNLRFGEPYVGTGSAESNSFRVKITRLDVLLTDAWATIQL